MTARVGGAGKNSTPWLHREGVVNGIRLHWVEAGRREDPLVVLLHGFPEFWYSWRHQIRALHNAGYRVVAPDLRGYNLSEKPSTGYDIDTLSNDVIELISLLTSDPVYLVGHDWGGVVAYATAARCPEKVRKLVVMNAPHLPHMKKEKMSWTQSCLLSYIAFFQVPFLPELLLGCNRAYFLGRGIRVSTSDPECLDQATIELYRDAISQRGALPCMLEYYRNLRRSSELSLRHDKIRSPTLILWGKEDVVLRRELYEKMSDYIDAPLDIVELDCGHWTPQEAPNEVNRQVLLFLARSSSI